MKKDKLIISVTIMIALTSSNYHIWINEIKALIEKSMIWQYVDSNIDLLVSKRSESSSSSDYMMIEEDVEASRSTISKKELTSEQQKKYKANCSEYTMLNRHHERITQRLRTVQSAIRTSAKQYILSNEFASSSRKIIQMLAARYKLDQSKIIEQIHEQWRKLKIFSVKNKIESWIAEWENLRLQMISLKLTNTFDDDVIFVSEFLRAERRWALIFCDTWENQLLAAEKSVEFFKITRAYKIVVNRKNSTLTLSFRATANAAILQRVTQDQVKNESFNQNEQRSINKSKSKKNNHSHQKRDEKCIWEEKHSFKKCSYIVKFNRKREWKKNKNIRNEMRDQIKKRLMIHRVIKHITNTNILNELNDSYFKKKRDENIFSSSAELKASSSFRFHNMTMSHMNEIHLLYKSVIYDSECSDSLTYDRNRFVNDLRSANEWIKTSNELMNVVDYETMIVNDKLSNKIVKLKFANTIWISSIDVILISFTRLIKEEYDRDSHINTLMHMKTSTKVCEISMHCNVLLLEFNLIKHANSIQSRKFTVTKATSWFWHFRLDHCRLEMIHQLKKIERIEMIKKDESSKTIDCETCAVSKMHRLMQKISAERATKFYEILHFDIIICKKDLMRRRV